MDDCAHEQCLQNWVRVLYIRLHYNGHSYHKLIYSLRMVERNTGTLERHLEEVKCAILVQLT